MNKMKDRSDGNQRLLTIEEACGYLGRGRNTARLWLDEIGATRHFGAKTIRFDKRVIDAALDQMTARALNGK